MSQLNTDSRSTNAREPADPDGRRTGAASAPARGASRILLNYLYPYPGLSTHRWS